MGAGAHLARVAASSVTAAAVATRVMRGITNSHEDEPMGSSAANTNGRTWERGRAQTGDTGRRAPERDAKPPQVVEPERGPARAPEHGPERSTRAGELAPGDAPAPSRDARTPAEPASPGVEVVPRDGEAPVLVAGGGGTSSLVTPVLEQLEVGLPDAGEASTWR